MCQTGLWCRINSFPSLALLSVEGPSLPPTYSTSIIHTSQGIINCILGWSIISFSRVGWGWKNEKKNRLSKSWWSSHWPRLLKWKKKVERRKRDKEKKRERKKQKKQREVKLWEWININIKKKQKKIARINKKSKYYENWQTWKKTQENNTEQITNNKKSKQTMRMNKHKKTSKEYPKRRKKQPRRNKNINKTKS